MEFDQAISKRHTVRSFTSKKPSWKLVLEAIDAAAQAPFADNHNHLTFLIVENEKVIDKIAEAADQLWINESGILVVVCSDDKHLENLHGERGRVYARQQAGAAIENFLLKITDLGLATCWVGSYNDEDIKHLLDIPKEIQIEAILPIGYEKGKTLKKHRKHLEHLLHWDSWYNRRKPALTQEPKDELEQEGHVKQKK